MGNNKDYIFSQETIDALTALGKVLECIHTRMLSEGWKIYLSKGEFITPPSYIPKRGLGNRYGGRNNTYPQAIDLPYSFVYNAGVSIQKGPKRR